MLYYSIDWTILCANFWRSHICFTSLLCLNVFMIFLMIFVCLSSWTGNCPWWASTTRRRGWAQAPQLRQLELPPGTTQSPRPVQTATNRYRGVGRVRGGFELSILDLGAQGGRLKSFCPGSCNISWFSDLMYCVQDNYPVEDHRWKKLGDSVIRSPIKLHFWGVVRTFWVVVSIFTEKY